jgi:hypothetical protein
MLAGRRLGGEHVLRQQRGLLRRRYAASQGARRRLHRREARTMKPGAGLGPLCTWINPETAIHSNTGNSPCSLSVVNLPSSTETSARRSSSRTAAARLGIRARYRNSSTAAISSGDSSTCRRSDR